jgi:hypothetical protein
MMPVQGDARVRQEIAVESHRWTSYRRPGARGTWLADAPLRSESVSRNYFSWPRVFTAALVLLFARSIVRDFLTQRARWRLEAALYSTGAGVDVCLGAPCSAASSPPTGCQCHGTTASRMDLTTTDRRAVWGRLWRELAVRRDQNEGEQANTCIDVALMNNGVSEC